VDTVVVEEDEGAADEDQRKILASNHRHSSDITMRCQDFAKQVALKKQ